MATKFCHNYELTKEMCLLRFQQVLYLSSAPYSFLSSVDGYGRLLLHVFQGTSYELLHNYTPFKSAATSFV